VPEQDEFRLFDEVEQALQEIVRKADDRATAEAAANMAKLARYYYAALVAVGFEEAIAQKLLFDWHMVMWGSNLSQGRRDDQ